MHLSIPPFPQVAMILSLAGLLGGFEASLLVTPRYVSTAEVQLTFGPATPSGVRPDLRERLMQIQHEILSRNSLSAIVQDRTIDLYGRERAHEPLEDMIERVRRDIKIEPGPPASDYLPFTISFTYREPEKTRRTVQALLTKFSDSNLMMQSIPAQIKRTVPPDQISRLEARIAELEKRLAIKPPPKAPETFVPAFSGINLEILDPPSTPEKPLYPNRTIFMLTGVGAGFMTAVVIAVFRRRLPPLPFPAQTA